MSSNLFGGTLLYSIRIVEENKQRGGFKILKVIGIEHLWIENTIINCQRKIRSLRLHLGWFFTLCEENPPIGLTVDCEETI